MVRRVGIGGLAVVLAFALVPPTTPVVAQDACVSEAEPNDAETDLDATGLTGATCVEAALPPGDQDLLLWEVGEADASTAWDLTLDGVDGTLTILQFFPLESEPGVQPIRARRLPIIELSIPPDSTEPAVATGVFMPVGRYLLGATRSGIPGGGEPDDVGYSVRIEPSSMAPTATESEPNDDEAAATDVSGAFDVSGDLFDGGTDVFAWDVAEAGSRWDLQATVPLEANVTMTVTAEGGRQLGYASGSSAVRLYDLALEPGRYFVQLAPPANEPKPYVLRARPAELEGDSEPNDESAMAVPLQDGDLVKGRLASTGDKDRYRLSIPAGDSDLRDVRMIWRTDSERRLCLLDGAEQPALCRNGKGGVALSALLLGPGDHVFEVSGSSQPEDVYALRVDATGPAPADFEAEPNDEVSLATRFDAATGVRARGEPTDVDVFRLEVEGVPQLWRLDLVGGPIHSLAWIRPNGSELARATIGAGVSTATLTDLYLVPGEHWFRARVDGPEYTLQAVPLGPPDPEGEREPNGDRVLAESYRIGQRKVGRLPIEGDVDIYRFTLAAPGHVRFTLAQPEDGAVELRLRHGDDVVSQRRQPETGVPLTWDLDLQPGDHLLELRPWVVSEGQYELTSERLDPFSLAADQEPNDDPAWARPIPASLSWQGEPVARGDLDWYALPPLTRPEALRVEVDDPEATVRFSAGGRQIVPEREGDGVFLLPEVPLGEPLDLGIGAAAPYHVEVSGGGLTPRPEPPSPALEVAWELPTDPLAAYWTEAQRVDGGLRLTNTGGDDVDVHLDTATSHYLWSAALAETDVSLGAGESVVVPVSVGIAADAWADDPVLVSARAVTPDGAAVSGSTELVATADGAPTGTSQGWPLPDELLGGLNVAFAGFGAVPANGVNPTWEPELFDGEAPDGGGFAHQAAELPVDLEVDLAGDAAVPVAGIVLDPVARNMPLSDVPRRFELWLSSDGVEWQPVLEDELLPLPLAQPFVLDEPQDARFARLRILSRHGGGAGYVALGEFKVVATPGATWDDLPVNIADPAMGGHVVITNPFTGDRELGTRLLTSDGRRDAMRLDGGPDIELVLGFHEGRAALVDAMEWVDPTGSNPATRLEAVEVWASTQTPLGPWTQLGTWSLAQAADGSVAPFTPPAGTWARYLRLTGEAPAEAREAELPESLRVLEAAPDEAYRSVVAEWGEGSSRGPLEWALPPPAVEWDPSSDAGDDEAGATPLPPGSAVTDRVEIDVDEDWYAIDVPEGMSGLVLVAEGRPTVGVALSLFDAAGEERPMAFVRQADGSVRYEARVEPGASYRLRVRQPPFSAVFTFDTSGSMGPFLDIVLQGMRTFAGEVRPGREAVMIVPFEDPPLLPGWQDDPYLLQDAVNSMAGLSGSSGAEAGLLAATELLAEREGARAVLLVTDAVTGTYRLGGELWEALGVARPVVFSVHIGAADALAPARDLMQDWAASGGGHYTYPVTHGAMDRAFERMATWLRRPAVYGLQVEAVNLDPGSISVVAPADGGAVALAPGVGIEIILDTSGSMLKRLAGQRRIEIAKASLDRLVDEALPEGVPLALRTFGGKGSSKKARCQTRLAQPLEPLDRAALRRLIAGIPVAKKTGTPIAAALSRVAQDLASVTGTRSVVLVTDGDATCGGDPAEAILALQEAGIDVAVNIVGFALDDEEVKARMDGWAEAGGGRYFDAAGAEDLVSALGAALGAPFRVYGPDGEVYEGGTVGGGTIAIDPGTYRVEVLTDPPAEFEEVVVAGGQSVVLELPSAE